MLYILYKKVSLEGAFKYYEKKTNISINNK